MQGKLTAETEITIHAGTDKVWKAITTPETIKQYLMGTNVTTDWKEGSPISYKGEYNGKAYEDMGKILKTEPEKTFQSTYWSSMGGNENKPENYNVVTYHLTRKDKATVVSLTQDNIQSEEEQKHVTANWKSVLEKLKEVVEKM